MKVAIVYDRVNKWGGAERVLLSLKKLFPDAMLFTSVYNEKTAPWAKVFEIKTSFLQNFPFAKTSHEFYFSLMPIAFESFSFDAFDIVISVTSEAAKGIITKPTTLHICICLTPIRYIWSGYDEYFNNPVMRIVSKPFVEYLKNWDKIAASRPDYFIAISQTVQKRIKEFYNRESEIIYPPVELPDAVEVDKSLETNYFLIVSRLVPYKKIDIAIKAANKLSFPLKIVGIGSDLTRLKSIAGPTVQFLQSLTDNKLSYYYKHCSALLFTENADFGLAIVEAQRFGKPVIAYKSGGALEIIQEGVTGEFFEHQTERSLIHILEKFDPARYNSKACFDNAKRFSHKEFETKFMGVVNKCTKEYFSK